jgi:hypothetical protein
VRITAANGNSSAFFKMKAPFFPPPNNEFYGRMMVWVDSAPTTNMHWTMIQAEGKVPNMSYSAVYTYGAEGKMIIANYDTMGGTSSDCWKNGTNLSLQKWMCVEWHFKGASNELELWVDGAAITGAHVVNKGDGCIAHDTQDIWYAPTFETLSLGYEGYGSDQQPHDLWIDDVALFSQRAGCPGP